MDGIYCFYVDRMIIYISDVKGVYSFIVLCGNISFCNGEIIFMEDLGYIS